MKRSFQIDFKSTIAARVGCTRVIWLGNLKLGVSSRERKRGFVGIRHQRLHPQVLFHRNFQLGHLGPTYGHRLFPLGRKKILRMRPVPNGLDLELFFRLDSEPRALRPRKQERFSGFWDREKVVRGPKKTSLGGFFFFHGGAFEKKNV